MKNIILPALVAFFALATMAMADNTPPNTTSNSAPAPAKTETTAAPADGSAAKTDRMTTCSKPMAPSTCSMHCGM